jgi:hypothetical protein
LIWVNGGDILAFDEIFQAALLALNRMPGQDASERWRPWDRHTDGNAG